MEIAYGGWRVSPAHGSAPTKMNRRGAPVHGAGLFRPSEIFVYGILDSALHVADPFLNLALRVLRRAFCFELGVARRFSYAFLDLACRLVGQAGNFVAGAAHVFHPDMSGPCRS